MEADGQGAVDVDEILGRDLNDRVPSSLRPFMAADERALIVIRGIPGAIVATDRRVIVERNTTPSRPEIYPYAALTGAVGRLGLFSQRSVALIGPGLEEHPNVFAIADSRNATVVAIWRLGSARQAVEELNALISAMRPDAGVQARGGRPGTHRRRAGARARGSRL